MSIAGRTHALTLHLKRDFDRHSDPSVSSWLRAHEACHLLEAASLRMRVGCPSRYKRRFARRARTVSWLSLLGMQNQCQGVHGRSEVL